MLKGHTYRRQGPQAPTEQAEQWRARAACRVLSDPDLMFPEQGQRAKVEQARRFCLGCPVRLECLEYSQRTAEEDSRRLMAELDESDQLKVVHAVPPGIWGGLTEQERAEELPALLSDGLSLADVLRVLDGERAVRAERRRA